MSVDTYFCFCCLSTSDLVSLYSGNLDTNYANILQDIFTISISQEDYEYDGYACHACSQRLEDAYKFRVQALEILNILKSSGLIEVVKHEKQVIVKKVTNVQLPENEEEKCAIDNTKSMVVMNERVEAKVPDTPIRPKKIKLEQVKQNNLDNIKIVEGSEIIQPIIDKSKRALERVNVENQQEKKGQQVKKVAPCKIDEFKCKICTAELPNLYVYHRHMNQHFPNHICEACGKGFLTEKRLKRHLPSHKTGPFKCPTCNEEFTNYNTMNSHRQRKHRSVYLYSCPECSERFRTLTRRALHLAAAHQRRAPRRRCPHCPAAFLLTGNLSAHIRNKHLKIKRHTCSECGAGFWSARELTAHVASHTHEKHFQCALCPKRYPRKKALVVHMRTHTDDRRFACEVCGKRFIQKCTLLVHANTHNRTDEKNADDNDKNVQYVVYTN